jgi:hypothetical protein
MIMARINADSTSDTLPCRSGFQAASVEATKDILNRLPETSPELLAQAHIRPDEWAPLLRAAIESMRGTTSATGTDKRRFIGAVLQYCQQRRVINSWSFIGSGGRQDYRITLPDQTQVAVEAKGCPDGNNTNIWDRPSWADEFIVWSLCPESLAHDPGKGVWSGVATRLLPKVAAEHKVVDAFIFWDGRCGTALRRCPKDFGAHGSLRSLATDLESQAGKDDWVPPPCVYLFPKSWPTIPHNLQPSVHTVSSCKFVQALFTAFNVPQGEVDNYTHSAYVKAKGTSRGTEIQITAVSRCWPDGNERVRTGQWKEVKREA